MKDIIIFIPGASERCLPLPESPTVLELADIPFLDMLAAKGETGLLIPGSGDIASAAAKLIGYEDISAIRSAESSFLALGCGLELKKDDAVFYCGFASLCTDEEEKITVGAAVKPELYQEAELISSIEDQNGNEVFSFVNAGDNCSFLIWHQGEPDPGRLYSPEQAAGKELRNIYSKGVFLSSLEEISMQCRDLLSGHAVNRIRKERGEQTADIPLFWGGSVLPAISSAANLTGSKWIIVSGNETLNGFGKYTGMTVIRPESDEINTLSEEIQKILPDIVSQNKSIFLDLSVLSIDNRSREEKKIILEKIDKNIISFLFGLLNDSKEGYRITVSCGMIKEAGTAPVPYIRYGNGIEPDNNDRFNERICTMNGNFIK